MPMDACLHIIRVLFTAYLSLLSSRILYLESGRTHRFVILPASIFLINFILALGFMVLRTRNTKIEFQGTSLKSHSTVANANK